MELNELAERLALLESGAAEDKAMREQTSFIDKYGSKFSGDEGIGVAILGELGRRGIDVSAADDAVQEILDQIRMEATTILDKIKMDASQVSDLMDKVNTIEEGINAATGDVPMSADMGMPPPPADMGMPMDDAGVPPPPMDDAGAPPMEEAPPAAEEMPPPPDGVPSDKRVKRVVPTTKQQSVFKPSRNLLAAIKGKL